MIYYCSFLAYVFIIYIISRQLKCKRRLFFLVTCIGVVLIQGCRSFSIGTDLAAYIPAYSKIGEQDFFNMTYQNFEPGYVLLNKFLYRMGIEERGFLIVVAAAIQIPIFYTIYRYSENMLMSILWYFAFGNFFVTFSALRQGIAMALCFAAYRFIRRKKAIAYCLLILFAAMFHKSALLCLVLYPAYFIRLKRKNFLGILIFFGVFYIVRTPIFIYMSKLYYGESRAITQTGAYTMFIIYILIYVISFYKKKEDVDYIGLRNILLILVMIYSFASMHSYVARIGFPLSLYTSLFVPRVVNNFSIQPKKIYYLAVNSVLVLSYIYLL